MRRLLLLSLLIACHPRVTPAPSPEAERPEVSYVSDPELQGLRVRLSDADEAGGAGERVPLADAQPLSADEAAGLLARLPELQVADEQAFALRSSSKPAPRPETEVDVPFPPPAGPPPAATDDGPLRVVRFGPEGDVPISPTLSVTFSKPMIALSSADEAAAQVPLTIAPEPPGQWRWLGTRTVVFEPDGRFPMATEYAVASKADAATADGEPLAEPAAFSFRTPPPSVRSAWPPPQPLGQTPVFVLVFDQAVDPAAIAGHARLDGPGKPALRVATEGELAADAGAARVTEQAQPGRAVALVPTAPLALASTFTLKLPPGLPSAEGPRTTTEAWSSAWQTYAPLAVVEHQCGWRDQCPPGTPWTIRFNNPLDLEAFDPESLAIEPELPHRVSASGNWITIVGVGTPKTRYTVQLPKDLTDAFGQQLGASKPPTFDVGPAEPTLQIPGNSLVVLDPDAPPQLAAFSIGHKELTVRAWKVSPKDWPAAVEWQRQWWQHEGKDKPPGQDLGRKRIRVAEGEGLVETAIPLGEWLPGDLGHLLVWVEPTRQPKEQWRRTRAIHWVQRTQLGLSAVADPTELLAWATELSTGAPAPGVSVELLPGEGATTDARGLATLPLPTAENRNRVLVARRGDDVALLPSSGGLYRGGAFTARPAADQDRFFVFDDRGLYKPGDTVRVKGYVRTVQGREGGDLAPAAVKTLRWILDGPRGNELARGIVKVSEFGGFGLSAELPDDVNLGTAWLRLRRADTRVVHQQPIKIAEFRRPEFEVSAQHDGGPHVLGGAAVATVEAKYFAGGGLAAADTVWTVNAAPGSYAPPGWDGWRFGVHEPWWRLWNQPASVRLDEHAGTTDGGGAHRLRIDFEALNPPRPMAVTASARVTDVNRQTWSANTDLVVHPGELYAAVQVERDFVQAGDPFAVELRAVSIDGVEAPGVAVAGRLERLEWRQKGPRWEEHGVDAQQCTGPTCVLTPNRGGVWRFTADVVDDAGRPNRTTFRVWVAGKDAAPNRGVQGDQVTLVPSGEVFAAGDVAEILVQAPFPDAEGLLTLRRSGVVHHERFTIDGASHTLRVPIEDAHVPSLTVQVDLVGRAPRDGGGERPAFATGSLQLKVPPLKRTLAVQLTPDADAVAPGATVVVDATVRDADGQPVAGAELALVAVDEAVLALTGHRVPDPLQAFYALRGPGASDHRLRPMLLLARPDQLFGALDGAPPADAAAAGFGGGGEGAEMDFALEEGAVAMNAPSPRSRSMAKSEAMPQAAPPEPTPEAEPSGPKVQVRSNFDALAAWEPSLVTGADGTVRATIDLPDSLTRYRLMAVAVSGATHFGSAEATITARKPIMLRPSPPRFANFGDAFELPVVVQNQTEADATVAVALRADGLALRTAGQRVTVPAGDRVEVRFPATTEHAGLARWQAILASGDVADAAEGSLTVWTPATTEAFATYGVLDAGATAQPLAPPMDAWPQFGGLEITTSSTALQALTDAVIHLSNYPFDCTEQLSSRILAITALRDVLAAFEAEGLPAPKELEAQVARDLAKLAARQRPDGGFGLWKRYERVAWPWASLHALHAIARAEQKGFAVDASMRQRGLNYLRNIRRHLPADYPESVKRVLRAHALYVRAQMGDADPKAARALLREVPLDELSLEAQGFVAHSLLDDPKALDPLIRHWTNRVAETAAAATFTTTYGDDAYLLMHSDRRTDGILLEALIAARPDSDLVPKVVEGLLGHRTKGHWGSTQDNAFVLLALDRYFATYEAETPDFVARVWLGEGLASEFRFEGRTTERANSLVPMQLLQEAGDARLVVGKEGPGRLYYRLGLKYAPKDLQLEPADRGFVVQRTYEAVDDAGDVTRDDDGTWRIKAGARVRVEVTMVAEARRHHVALVDPMPAGLEALNPDLKTTEALPETAPEPSRRGWWWWGPWYDHDNLRDERAEAFAAYLRAGVHTYRYFARATTPGRFVVPPPKAEEMYHPETFGRGASAVVIVE